MTNENQSAVDFLINQWLYLDTEFEMGLMDKNTYWQKLREIQAQSKQMFENQIMDAMDWIMNKYFEFHEQPTTSAREQYYNETFKSE
jgi:hypothetical protein